MDRAALAANRRRAHARRELTPSTVMVAAKRRPRVAALLAALKKQPDFKVVAGPAPPSAELLTQIAEQGPSVLLLDEDVLGTPAARLLHSRFPALFVLLLCGEADPALVDTLVSCGFHGYLADGEPVEACIRAVRSVRRGELWLPRAALARFVSHRNAGVGAMGVTDSDRRLTPREQQVADYLRRGCSNKEIAQVLGIKEDTVKKHLRRVFSKVGVKRRTQLMLRG